MSQTLDKDAKDKWVLRVLRIPVEVGTAKFGKELGKGQFGKAFLLKDGNDQPLSLVAKTALNDETAQELRNEAEFYGKAGDHPNIARCYGILKVDGQDALVMEAIKGRNMSATMDVLDKLRTGDARTLAKYGLTRQITQSDYVGALQHITLEMLKGLAHLEESGVVHKDVRPDNVMIDQATGEVKLIDFGVAQDAGAKGKGKVPVFSGSVSPDFESEAPLTSKHDMFALGEAARKTMESDQFRYLTGKDGANLTKDDVRAFGEPGPEGTPKQALNPRSAPTPRPQQAPSRLAVRVAEIAESAAPLLQDNYVGRHPVGQTLAGQLNDAQAIAGMGQQQAERLVADMEENLAKLVKLWPMYRGGSYDPLEPAKTAIQGKLASLRGDPSIARSETGQRLARREEELNVIRDATRTGDPAAQLAQMQTRLKDDVAGLAGRIGATVTTTDPVDQQIGALLGQPNVKGTASEAQLRKLQRDLSLIDRFATAPDPAVAIQDHLRVIRNEVAAAETDLKRTGTFGAETDYTRFVNWMMNPDPTRRPSPGKLLKLIGQLDAMDAGDRKAALDKLDPRKPDPTGNEATERMPIRFLADRLGDASSMRQLLSSVLGKAEAAEPPPPPTQPQQTQPQQTQPQPTTVDATSPAPNPTRRRRAIFDDDAPTEMKPDRPARGGSGGGSGPSTLNVDKLEMEYSSKPGDDEKTPTSASSTTRTGGRVDTDKLEAEYYSKPDEEGDGKEPKSTASQTGSANRMANAYASRTDDEEKEKEPKSSTGQTGGRVDTDKLASEYYSKPDDDEKKPTSTTWRPSRKDDDEPKPPGYI
ncbi:MAG: protein kinase [Rhodospirillales bacterium]|nr:protein kinase [Rhodospirillales bacterium]